MCSGGTAESSRPGQWSRPPDGKAVEPGPDSRIRRMSSCSRRPARIRRLRSGVLVALLLLGPAAEVAQRARRSPHECRHPTAPSRASSSSTSLPNSLWSASRDLAPSGRGTFLTRGSLADLCGAAARPRRGADHATYGHVIGEQEGAASSGGAGDPTGTRRVTCSHCASIRWRFEGEAHKKALQRAAPRPGFEPGAYSLGGSRSIQLSYRGRPAVRRRRPTITPPDASRVPVRRYRVGGGRAVGWGRCLSRSRDRPSPPRAAGASGRLRRR